MGAKQGRTKGNEQKAEYAKPGEADGKPAVDDGEKDRGRKKPGPGQEASCEAEVRRAERKKQRLSSRRRKVSGRKKARPEAENMKSESWK